MKFGTSPSENMHILRRRMKKKRKGNG